MISPVSAVAFCFEPVALFTFGALASWMTVVPSPLAKEIEPIGVTRSLIVPPLTADVTYTRSSPLASSTARIPRVSSSDPIETVWFDQPPLGPRTSRTMSGFAPVRLVLTRE